MPSRTTAHSPTPEPGAVPDPTTFAPAERARLEKLRAAVRAGQRNDYGAGWQYVLFLRWLYQHRPWLRG